MAMGAVKERQLVHTGDLVLSAGSSLPSLELILVFLVAG